MSYSIVPLAEMVAVYTHKFFVTLKNSHTDQQRTRPGKEPSQPKVRRSAQTWRRQNGGQFFSAKPASGQETDAYVPSDAARIFTTKISQPHEIEHLGKARKSVPLQNGSP